MESSSPPLRLDVSRLNLTPEDADYEDAIACVSMYWKHAVLLSPSDQQQMIQVIMHRRYMMNKSSRASIAAHRMYRAATKHERCNTWSTYLILNAVYRQVPWQYEFIVQEKFGSSAIENRLNSYFAFYPNTIWPDQADNTGEHATRFKAAYPKVKNVPYWARMGLPEPKAIDFRTFRADSVQSEDSNVDMDTTANYQDSAMIQPATDAMDQNQDAETRSCNTPPSHASSTEPPATQDEFNIDNIVEAITSGRGSHQVQRMQAIAQSMNRLEETLKDVVRQQEFEAFREECNVFREELNDFREEFNVFREQELAFKDEMRQFMAAIARSFSASI
ncbi:hypothetical protein ACHAPE_003128 [Trichoderma viride]